MKWLFSLHVFFQKLRKRRTPRGRCQAGRGVLAEIYGWRAFGADDAVAVVTVSAGLPRLP